MLDYLWQRNFRQFIYKNIIHSAVPLGDEMAHHLYVLQALTLGLLEPRMRTPLDPYSQVCVFGEVQGLRLLAAWP